MARPGYEPATSRSRSGRSTTWAIGTGTMSFLHCDWLAHFEALTSLAPLVWRGQVTNLPPPAPEADALPLALSGPVQCPSYTATDWPTLKLLHHLQVVSSNPSLGFKAGNIHCQIILKGLNKLHCPLPNFSRYLANHLRNRFIGDTYLIIWQHHHCLAFCSRHKKAKYTLYC